LVASGKRRDWKGEFIKPEITSCYVIKIQRINVSIWLLKALGIRAAEREETAMPRGRPRR
jgi:hypothetical protein